MKKRFVVVIAITSLLPSCIRVNNRIELRSDIKEFIASFSLEQAMEEYLSCGLQYAESYTVKDGTKTTKTTKTEIIVMNYISEQYPSYYRTVEIKENDVLKESVMEYINRVEDKYYFHKNDEQKEISATEVSNLFVQFFYTTTQNEGQYHSGGYYYGDYVTDISPVLQDYVTIDQENQLYIYDYNFENAEKTIKRGQRYTVNSLGMIVENHKYAQNSTENVEINFRVFII